MKKIFTFLFCLSLVFTASAEEFEISTNGLSYSPSELTVNVGDVVNFVISSSHPTTQVSEDTWNANGTDALAGGFGTNSSNFSVTITEDMVPTIYYVCDNHVGMGMKGTITVNPTSVEDLDIAKFEFGPNPSTNGQLNYTMDESEFEGSVLTLFNVTGKLVFSERLTSATGTIMLDVARGNYILQVKDKDNKIIVNDQLVVN